MSKDVISLKQIYKGSPSYDLTGSNFGKWKVESYHGKSKNGALLWNCRCECGTFKAIKGTTLRAGESLGCYCANLDNRSQTHGMSRTPTYASWTSMRRRCNDPKSKDWKYYGGRGISYDKRWNNILIFIEEMGLRPEGKTIDRIDSNKDYCKSNCKWSTPSEQVNNRNKFNYLVDKSEPDL
mgnify:CR=1 FL=1